MIGVMTRVVSSQRLTGPSRHSRHRLPDLPCFLSKHLRVARNGQAASQGARNTVKHLGHVCARLGRRLDKQHALAAGGAGQGGARSKGQAEEVATHLGKMGKSGCQLQAVQGRWEHAARCWGRRGKVTLQTGAGGEGTGGWPRAVQLWMRKRAVKDAGVDPYTVNR